ncbi:FMN-binding negative transcriptional regulator [Variovorax sp. LjRoot175]|uniref:FMN-binding negative transcriptional regulator n=1 Tax=Variovorax sp. LjRoot175 TaxID=3342276 RepID=UPI003ED0F985
MRRSLGTTRPHAKDQGLHHKRFAESPLYASSTCVAQHPKNRRNRGWVEKDGLGFFQGPNAYISPRWYVNGQRSGRLRPRWNCIAVQVRGPLRFIDDGAWLLAHLASLAARQELHRERPWSLADTSAHFWRTPRRH